MARRVVLSLFILGALAALGRADGFEDLVGMVPPNANTLILVDFEALKASPLGQKKNWARKHEEDFVAREVGVPPTATRMAMAALMNPTTLNNTWEAGVIQLSESISLTRVARSLGGTLDQVAGRQVVLTHNNSYMVALKPQIGGILQPANRQELSRWVKQVDAGPAQSLSPYLRRAAASATRSAQVALALDLGDVIDPDGVRKRLSKNESTLGKGVDIEKLTQLLVTLKGVTLFVRVDDAISGEMRIDFGGDCSMLADIGKPLVLRALDAAGAHLDDFQNWNPRVESNTFVLYGSLGEHDLRQILDVIEISPMPSGQPGGSPQDQVLASTMAYWKSMTTLIDEMNNKNVKSFNSLAYWFGKYAQKIDQLPTLNVDKELVTFGANVASAFRLLSDNARGVQVSTEMMTNIMGAMQIQVPSSSFTYDNGWNYGTYTNYRELNPADYTVRAASKTAVEGKVRTAIFNQVVQTTANLRKILTDRYKVEFPAPGTASASR
jgi:hypothetical protein